MKLSKADVIIKHINMFTNMVMGKIDQIYQETKKLDARVVMGKIDQIYQETKKLDVRVMYIEEWLDINKEPEEKIDN